MPKYLYAFLPAIFLVALATAVIVGGLGHDAGTLERMGPGFMPVLLGSVLLGLALLLGIGEWRSQAHAGSVAPQPSGRTPLRPILCASLSIVLWALLVERLGFIPAALGQLLLARAALSGTEWKRAGVGSAVVSALAYVLFVLVLGLPLQAVGI